jgi:hypothetical protein
MKFWTDETVKGNAKALARMYIEHFEWKECASNNAELTAGELALLWNNTMKANSLLNLAVHHIDPTAAHAANQYATVLAGLFQAVNPKARDERNITLEICVLGSIAYLHENHAFMLAV